LEYRRPESAGGEAARARARDVLIERRWIIAALLFLSGLINYLDRTIISVALPVISRVVKIFA
jgi:hypothetical protein